MSDANEVIVPALLDCPKCGRNSAPSVVRGPRSGKFLLSPAAGCQHVWSVIDYRSTAVSEAEAAERWNAWANANHPA